MTITTTFFTLIWSNLNKFARHALSSSLQLSPLIGEKLKQSFMFSLFLENLPTFTFKMNTEIVYDISILVTNAWHDIVKIVYVASVYKVQYS